MTARIAKLSRGRLLEQDGGGALFFVVHVGRRPDYLQPDQVPEFEGDEAWFELERTRSPAGPGRPGRCCAKSPHLLAIERARCPAFPSQASTLSGSRPRVRGGPATRFQRDVPACVRPWAGSPRSGKWPKRRRSSYRPAASVADRTRWASLACTCCWAGTERPGTGVTRATTVAAAGTSWPLQALAL